MSVDNFLKLLLIFLFVSIDAQAKFIGAIGFVGSKPPAVRMSRDVGDFFNDFRESAYDSYGDAGIAVVNKNNIKRGEVIYKDVKYDNTFLIPSEDNDAAISEFYRHQSRRFLNKVAQENKVDILLFSKFNRTKLRRIFRKKPNPAVLAYNIFAYDVQTGAKSSKYVYIKVTDLFSAADYDADQFTTHLIEKYLVMFDRLLGHMKMVGSSYSQDTDKTTSKSKEDKSSDNAENGEGDW